MLLAGGGGRVTAALYEAEYEAERETLSALPALPASPIRPRKALIAKLEVEENRTMPPTLALFPHLRST